jgi:hypothetical protein
MKELNPFSFERTKASSIRRLSLRDTLEMVLGYRPTYMSKRLLPAMGMANARIYFCGTRSTALIAVWDGDLDFHKVYKSLAQIAEKYGVILHVFSEMGQKPVWTSEKPDAWLGFVSEDWNIPPIIPGRFPDIEIAHVYPYYRKMAEETQQQWLEDHGLAKRKRKQPRGKAMAAAKKIVKKSVKVASKVAAKHSSVKGKGIKKVAAKGRAGSSRRS